jgi:hypothetical protein
LCQLLNECAESLSPNDDDLPDRSRAEIKRLDSAGEQEEEETPMSEEWIRTRDRLPRNGEVVLVKTFNNDLPQKVTFFQHPVGRWESGSVVFQLERYKYWRRVTANNGA